MNMDRMLFDWRFYQFISKIIILFLFLNCATLQKLAKIQKPAISVKSVRISDFSFKKLDLTFDINIENPNDLSVSLAGFDYDFWLNDASFIKGKNERALTIDGLASNTIDIPLELQFQDIYQTYKAVKDQDSLQYKMILGFNLNLPILGETRIPVNHNGHVPMLKLPELKFRNIHIKKMGLTKSEILLNIKLNNPNFFGFNLKYLSYDLKVAGYDWAIGKINRQYDISSKSSNDIVIPITLDLLQMGQAVFKIISTDNNINYTFDGILQISTSHLLFKEFNIPLTKSGQIPILR
jgi:LEA14-like dessication related protein